MKEGGGVCMCRRGVKIGRMGKEEEKGQEKMWGGGGGGVIKDKWEIEKVSYIVPYPPSLA